METRWGMAARDGVRTASPALRGVGLLLLVVVGAAGLARAGDQTSKGSPRKHTSAIPQVAAIDKGIAEGWAAAWDQAGDAGEG